MSINTVLCIEKIHLEGKYEPPILSQIPPFWGNFLFGRVRKKRKSVSILSQISQTPAAAPCQRSNFIHLDSAAPGRQFIYLIFSSFREIMNLSSTPVLNTICTEEVISAAKHENTEQTRFFANLPSVQVK